MDNTGKPMGEIAVDSRGRTSLAKVRDQVFARYRATEHPDGTIVLTPLVTMTPAELGQVVTSAGLYGAALDHDHHVS